MHLALFFPQDGDTPLLKAVRVRHLDMVQLLLSRNARVSAADKVASCSCFRCQGLKLFESIKPVWGGGKLCSSKHLAQSAMQPGLLPSVND